MARMGRPVGIKGPIAELAKKIGGVQALADEVNVDPRTIRYWANGELTPSGPARKLLGLMAEPYGIQMTFGEGGGTNGKRKE